MVRSGVSPEWIPGFYQPAAYQHVWSPHIMALVSRLIDFDIPSLPPHPNSTYNLEHTRLEQLKISRLWEPSTRHYSISRSQTTRKYSWLSRPRTFDLNCPWLFDYSRLFISNLLSITPNFGKLPFDTSWSNCPFATVSLLSICLQYPDFWLLPFRIVNYYLHPSTPNSLSET